MHPTHQRTSLVSNIARIASAQVRSRVCDQGQLPVADNEARRRSEHQHPSALMLSGTNS